MSSADPRQGIELRAGWFGREFVPFDAMAAVAEGTVTLESGDARPVPPDDRAAVAQALSPPAARGTDADADALVAYIAGPWSPVRAAQALLAMATAARASDVHVEAEDDAVQVRLRRAGALEPFATLPPDDGTRLIAALKHLAGCLPYRADLVQEGRIPRDGVAADVRASFLPTALGERAALRLFGSLLPLDALGLEPATLASVRDLLQHRSGLVLVAGPSGAGKTTTVYAALAHLAASRPGAHLSIEDPVEQRLRLAGIAVDQVELAPDKGLTAEAALAGALRQDLDVIGLAEIRTPAEAGLAVRAAHTGRLVIAGIHAGSTDEARQRMLDLDVEPAVLTTTLRGVLHQELQTRDCPDPTPSCPACQGAGRLRRPSATLWTAP